MTADYRTVDPWVISADTPAEIDFLAEVFGAHERGERVLTSAGRVGHAEVAIADAVLMLFDSEVTRPAYLRVYVDDVAACLERAMAGGARTVTRPTELFWGDVTARFRDPQGHLWWVSQRLDVDPATIEARAADPVLAAAMAYVQESLGEEFRRDTAGTSTDHDRP